MDAEIKGDKLVITVDLSAKPTQSKSALAKADDPSKVPANLIASSGGFVRIGKAKYSLNVMTA